MYRLESVSRASFSSHVSTHLGKNRGFRYHPFSSSIQTHVNNLCSTVDSDFTLPPFTSIPLKYPFLAEMLPENFPVPFTSSFSLGLLIHIQTFHHFIVTFSSCIQLGDLKTNSFETKSSLL